MKLPLTYHCHRNVRLALVLGGLLCLSFDGQGHDFSTYDRLAIVNDLSSYESIVDMRHTPEVEAYIRRYLVNNRSKAERVIKRMMRYFPLIERKLREHNLPDELKYLCIVESALDPSARSCSGAVGLWQLMSPTAKDLGIRIYHSVDERRDPYRSTDAALAYLSKLYDRFGDWELALAGYNSGPNRIGRLMAETNKTDYWSLREDLPRETANYIPAFIAASYIFSDFAKHGLVAERSHPDFHFFSKVEVFNHKVYLQDVAHLMKIDLDTLKILNPMYKRTYIPASPNGYNLILPNRCLSYFQVLADTLGKSEYVRLAELPIIENINSEFPDSIQDLYVNSEYIVQNKENLFSVAKMFNLDVHQLKYWNILPSLHVDHGMIIDIPLSFVEGKFLIRDYKHIKVNNKILPSKLRVIAVRQEKQRLHILSNALLENQKGRIKNTMRSDFQYFVMRGVPLAAQLSAKDFDRMQKIKETKLIDLSLGRQIGL